MTKYPRKGQHGEPISRCNWCGKPLTSLFGDKRYCSAACRAADNYEATMCTGWCATCTLALTIFSALMGLVVSAFLSLTYVLAIFLPLSCFGPYLLWAVGNAKKMRENEHSRTRLSEVHPRTAVRPRHEVVIDKDSDFDRELEEILSYAEVEHDTVVSESDDYPLEYDDDESYQGSDNTD